MPLILGGELFSPTHVTNDAVAGLLLLGCGNGNLRLATAADLELRHMRDGLWLLAAQSVLSYRDPAAGNSATVGVLILAVSGLEVWRLAHADSR